MHSTLTSAVHCLSCLVRGDWDLDTQTQPKQGRPGSVRMPGGMVKEEPGLSNSQMSTQPHLFRSHTGVLERGVGREPLLSNASTQELEAALAIRREQSQVSRDREEREKERDQKKPRLLQPVAPKLPEFGGSMQHVRKGGEEEGGVEHFDLTGDDDLMGEGGGTAGPAPTVPDNDAVPVPGDELSAPYTAQAAGADAPPWVHSLLPRIELMHRKQDCAGKIGLMRQDVDTAKGRIDTLEEVTQYTTWLIRRRLPAWMNLRVNSRLSGQGQLERRSQVCGAALLLPLFEGIGIGPPVGSRSPRDAEAEFQIVMGGWKDARRTEAEEEADKILRAAGFSGGHQRVLGPLHPHHFCQDYSSLPGSSRNLASKENLADEAHSSCKEPCLW